MLTKDEILDIEMNQYLLKNKSDLVGADMSEYHIENFNIREINEKLILINVNYKSNISQRNFTEINGQPISMDYLIVRQLDIDKNHYLNFIRNKKISKLKDGIS